MAKKQGLGVDPFAAKDKDKLNWMDNEPEPIQTADFGTPVSQTAYGMEKAENVVLIPWDLILPDERNFFAQNEIEELAESIAEIGLQHNCVVRPIDGGRFKLISGHRRWAACKYLSENGNEKFNRIMCQVLEVDELDSEIMLINDNNKTRTISPMERIKSIERLTQLIAEKRKRGEVKGKTRDLVGEIIGITGVEVHRIQKVQENLLPELIHALDRGTITFRSAIDLATKPKELQEKVAKKVAAAEVMSTSQVAKLSEKVEAKGAKQDDAGMEPTHSEVAEKWLTGMRKSIASIQKQTGTFSEMKAADAEAVEAIKDGAVKACCELSLAWYDLVKVLGAENIEYLFADTLEKGKADAGEPISDEEEDRAIRMIHSILAAHKRIQQEAESIE